MSTSEIGSKVAELRELRRMAAELAEQISALENEVKAEMLRRDTDTLSGLDYKVTWKEVTSSRFDTEAFKSAYASLYTAFTRPGGFPPLRHCVRGAAALSCLDSRRGQR